MTWNGSGKTPPRLPEPRRPKPRPAEPKTPTATGSTTGRTGSVKPAQPRSTVGGKPRTERRPALVAAEESAAGNWLRGLRLSGFSFVMMGILVLAVIVLAPNVRTYAEQRQQIDELRNAVALQEADVDGLKAERERWNDRTYVTTQARARLSYVMPGDVSFLVLNDLGQAVDASADTAPISTDIQDTDVDWVDSMFTSVMTAGLAPQEAAQ